MFLCILYFSTIRRVPSSYGRHFWIKDGYMSQLTMHVSFWPVLVSLILDQYHTKMFMAVVWKWVHQYNISPKVGIGLLPDLLYSRIDVLQNCCGRHYNKLARLANFSAMFHRRRNFRLRSGWLENSNEAETAALKLKIFKCLALEITPDWGPQSPLTMSLIKMSKYKSSKCMHVPSE